MGFLFVCLDGLVNPCHYHLGLLHHLGCPSPNPGMPGHHSPSSYLQNGVCLPLPPQHILRLLLHWRNGTRRRCQRTPWCLHGEMFHGEPAAASAVRGQHEWCPLLRNRSAWTLEHPKAGLAHRSQWCPGGKRSDNFTWGVEVHYLPWLQNIFRVHYSLSSPWMKRWPRDQWRNV